MPERELAAIEVSVVIPVFNEEVILSESVLDLREKLRELTTSFEIVIAENGSRDQTRALADDLARRFPEVRCLSIEEPNYGRALKQGILASQGRYVLCDEIDLCDVDFHQRALELLRSGEADLVVGSKVMAGAEDERPFARHVATRVITLLLRLAVGFRGTDTHGLKAFCREPLLETVRRCVVDKDLFASEFVIRAQREGKRCIEIPVRVLEKRKPSIRLFQRVPRVLRDLFRLFVAIRLGKK